MWSFFYGIHSFIDGLGNPLDRFMKQNMQNTLEIKTICWKEVLIYLIQTLMFGINKTMLSRIRYINSSVWLCYLKHLIHCKTSFEYCYTLTKVSNDYFQVPLMQLWWKETKKCFVKVHKVWRLTLVLKKS